MGNPAQQLQQATPAASKSRFQLEDIIVFFFALLGFIGCVVLYQMSTAPVIVSVFLATGVAALVYRFLGGIQGATFAWGALKLGGTIAALVGVAVLINGLLERELLVVVPIEGQYEWQWAGEGWKGYVEVNKDGSANIDMQRYQTCGAGWKQVKLLQQAGAGKAEGVHGSQVVRVSIPVQFIHYDSNCGVTGIDKDETVLEGVLTRTPAFAGRIKYHSKYGAQQGDMILVKN